MNIFTNILYNNTLFMGVLDWLEDGFRLLEYWICKFIYMVITFFYQIFMVMCRVRILDQEGINGVYRRITVLLGLIMMFVTIFYLIRLLLTPEKINDKEMGVANLIKKLVVVVVLVGFSSTIFDLLYDVQDAILDSNIISKILIGTDLPDDDSLTTGYGREISIMTFLSFFSDDPDTSECTAIGTPMDESIKDEYLRTGSLTVVKPCLNEKDGDEYQVDFDGFAAIIVGGIMVWLLFSYVLAVGVRVIQFTFLQLISPIPIISYLLPQNGKDTMFNRWVKQVTSTYVDLFVRVAIISFIIYLTQIIWTADFYGMFVDSGIGQTLTGKTLIWTRIALIIALLAFGKRFPQLVQELTGKPSAASIGFGLNNDATRIAAGAAAGIALGAAGSTGFGRFTSAITGGIRGIDAGMRQGNFAQNMDRARRSIQESNRRDEWLKMQGQGFVQRMGNRAIMASGGIPKAQREEYLGQMYEQTKATFDDDDTVKAFKGFHGTAISQGTGAAMTALEGSGFLQKTGSKIGKADVYSITDERGDEIAAVTKGLNGQYYMTSKDSSGNYKIDNHNGLTIQDFDNFAKQARENKWQNPLAGAQTNAKKRALSAYRMEETTTFKTFSDRGKDYKSRVMDRGGVPFGASGGPKPW